MSIFYLDYDLGIDSGGIATDTPLGWWSVAYTGGTAPAPAADEVVSQGASQAKLTVVVAPTGGSWVGGNASGVMYFYGKTAAFAAGQVDFAGGGHMHIAADFNYNPWKTITLGATAARMAPGDTVRIKKSPVPVSIGNAAWTNLSKVVTLAAARTLNIAMCEVDWASVNATSSAKIGTDWKEGTYALKLVEDGTPGANELQAYFATGVLAMADMANYQSISFWIKNEVAIAAGVWVIKLCSDVAGAVEEDVFPIPAIPSTGCWVPLTLTRTGGGNLGDNGTADIQSIAVYNGAVTPTASKYIYLDNIIATKTGDLNLQSLISQNATAKGSAASVNASEGWFGIQSINGTAVLLDNDTNTLANAGRGYSGVSNAAAPTYIRETIKTAMAASSGTQIQVIQESGSLGLLESYEGGYNPVDNIQDGETFFDGLNSQGYGLYFYSKSFTSINYLNFLRYNSGIYYNSSNNNTIITVSNANNNAVYGIYYYYSSNNNIKTMSATGNGTSAVFNDYGINYLRNATLVGTKFAGAVAFANSRIYSDKHDGTLLNHYIYTDYGNIASADGPTYGHTTTAGTICWKLSPTNVVRNSSYPLDLKIAKIAVVANKFVTVKAWFKVTNTTDIFGKLVLRANQIAGDANCSGGTSMTTHNVNTNYEELTITFTPSEAGVVEIEAWAYWAANAADESVYVDDITITQAA